METGFTNRMIKQNTFFVPQDKNTFEAVVQAYEGGRIYVYDSSPVVEDICNEIKAFVVQNGTVGAVFIDYLQLLSPLKRTNDPRRDLDYCLVTLDNLRKELKITMFLLLQPTGAVESRQDKRPKLADSKETSMTRQIVDIGLYLYRDDRYNPQSSDRGLIEIGCEKNRDYEAGWVVKPVFDGAKSRIGNAFVSILDQQKADYVPPQQLPVVPQDTVEDEEWEDM